MQGIQMERIEPGHPEQNGGHERMHGDIARELECEPSLSWEEECRRLERWRVEYNVERPHEALEMKTPGEMYRRSSRRYKGDVEGWDYPPHFDQRRVRRQGSIKIAAREVYISEALKGWHVGLERRSMDTVTVWFCDLILGEVDLGSRTPLRPIQAAEAVEGRNCHPCPGN
jgi:hypothetical protein